MGVMEKSSRIPRALPIILTSKGKAWLSVSTVEIGAAKKLLAEAGFYGDPLPSFSAAAGKHLLAALGLHARAKTMLLASLAPVGLECTLGHEK
jgi:threonine synthase